MVVAQADLVTRSYGRCLAQDNLLFDRFYGHFLKSSPIIAKMFIHTDMVNQKALLRAGLNYAIMFSTDSGKLAAEGVLARIQKSHSRSRIDVDPKLYPLWTNSLLKALEETDPKFTPELRKAWEHVLNHAVAYIISGY